MLPASWLKAFLRSQELEQPDGRMLFAYRLSDEHYATLRESLAEMVEYGGLKEVSRVSGFAAAFVLFASEWWRREYQGGEWRWSAIIEAFNANPEEFSTQERSACVSRGLAYWGHRPQAEGMRFFGSIVAQAGLPLNLLARQSGAIASLLSRTLTLAGRYRWNEDLILLHIARHEGDLPQSIRLPEIFQLLTHMVSTALDFRQEFKRSGLQDPVAFLKQEPGWRRRFPLPMDDEHAEALLQGLVKQASLIETTRNGIMAVQRLLQADTSGEYHLYSRVVMPLSAESDIVAAFFRLAGADDLPRYFSVDLLTVDRSLLADGRQLLGATKSTVAFSERTRTVQGRDALAEHRIQLRSDQAELACHEIPLPGGAELEVDAPWIFSKRDDDLVLVGAGSARLPDQEVLVSLPTDGWSLEGNGDVAIEEIGVVRVDGSQRSLVRVRGEVLILGPGEQFKVRTGQAVDEAGSYVWLGKRLPFDSVPRALFLGTPRLYRYSAEGDPERIPDSRIVWRRIGNLDPVSDFAALRGAVEARLMDGEEVVVRYRMVIANPDAKVRFVSGGDESEGGVVLEDWGSIEVSPDAEDLTSSILAQGRQLNVKMRAHGKPPEIVTLRLRWVGHDQDLALLLPFPCSGGRFFDAEGVELQSGSCLTVDELPGLRLRVFDRNPDKPQKYEVRLLLQDPANPKGLTGSNLRHPIRLTKSGEGDLRLVDLHRDIEVLLGFSRHLDAVVEVSLFVGGRVDKFVKIRRYDAEVVPEERQLVLQARGGRKISNAEWANVRLAAVPLAHLDAPGELLEQTLSEGVATGAWEISQLDEARAPWFLYPSCDSVIRFRPTLWMPKADEGSDDSDADVPQVATPDQAEFALEVRSLAEAICLERTDLRLKAIRQVMERMSGNPKDPSWLFLRSLWNNFSHLPLSSLDVWRVLSGNMPTFTSALFQLGLQTDQLRTFIVRFQRELGAVLELATLPMWRAAVAGGKVAWASQFGEEVGIQVIPILLKSQLDVIAEAAPSVAIVMDVMRFEATGEATEQILKILSSVKQNPYRFSEELYKGADCLLQQVLLRAHGDEAQWPSSRLFTTGIQELHRVSSKPIQGMILDHLKRLFWPNHEDFKAETANLPVLCALWVVTGGPHQWWTGQRRLELQQVRAFDPVWFEQAFSHGVAFAIANQFSS